MTSTDTIQPNELHENGRAPFPETILVSTERSGCNLVRHCVETMAQRRTPGKVHLIDTGPLLFHRTHRARWNEAPLPACAAVFDPSGRPLYRKMILLLRDPVELFVRAFEGELEEMTRYCDNIAVFHDFPGEKLLVTYDELVTSDAAMKKVFAFLGIEECFDGGAMASVRADSVAWYNKNERSGSQTEGRADRLRYHQSAMTEEGIAAVWDFLAKQLDCAQMQYVLRWKYDLPAATDVSVIQSRPKLTAIIDFTELKSTIIACGEPDILVGRRENIDDHLDQLFKEFSGQPLIAFYHAALIVRLRRGEDVALAFKDLWSAEGDFLQRNLRLRWLISACDSIIDVASFDPADRALALAASLLTSAVKLYETELLALDGRHGVSHYKPVSIQPLFDGMTTFAIGHGDLIRNLMDRCRAASSSGKIAGMILEEVLRRLHTQDTVFKRFLSIHTSDETRWSV